VCYCYTQTITNVKSIIPIERNKGGEVVEVRGNMMSCPSQYTIHEERSR
jgi:hypothetical protein